MVKRVLIAAGGTGGHIFPALAVVHLLQQHDIEVAWLGSKKNLEQQILAKEKIPFYQLGISNFRGKNFLRFITIPCQITVATLKAIRIIRHFKPDIVLGMGGFASGPGGLAAWLMRKTLVIHEQNAILGLTNKILSHFAAKILTGFPNTKGINAASKSKCIYVGNPVRAAIQKLAPPDERLNKHDGPTRLLILGGSQGALSFNQIIPQAINLIPNTERPLIRHQAGPRYLDVAQTSYQKFGLKARVDAFIADMAAAYSWADLIIARAGAATITELSTIGIAAILIPYPYAVDDHQTANATFLKQANAAYLLKQHDFNPNTCAKYLSQCLNNRAKLLQLAKNARSLHKIDAAKTICTLLCNLMQP